MPISQNEIFVQKILEKNGFSVSHETIIGIPDFKVGKEGEKDFYIEVKTIGDELNYFQKKRINNLLDGGIKVYYAIVNCKFKEIELYEILNANILELAESQKEILYPYQIMTRGLKKKGIRFCIKCNSLWFSMRNIQECPVCNKNESFGEFICKKCCLNIFMQNVSKSIKFCPKCYLSIQLWRMIKW